MLQQKEIHPEYISVDNSIHISVPMLSVGQKKLDLIFFTLVINYIYTNKQANLKDQMNDQHIHPYVKKSIYSIVLLLPQFHTDLIFHIIFLQNHMI